MTKVIARVHPVQRLLLKWRTYGDIQIRLLLLLLLLLWWSTAWHACLDLNFKLNAPVQQIGLFAEAAQTLFELVEGRTLDGRLVAGQRHQLTSLERHTRRRCGSSARMQPVVAGNVHEQVANDDAEAEDIRGASRLRQSSVPLYLGRKVSERAALVCVVTEVMKNTLAGAATRLVPVGSTHDVVQCLVLPVDDGNHDHPQEPASPLTLTSRLPIIIIIIIIITPQLHSNNSTTLNFISELGRREIYVHTGDVRQTSYLFQSISMMLQRFTSTPCFCSTLCHLTCWNSSRLTFWF